MLIAGPSGSGKSTIAQTLVASMPPHQAQVLTLDHYYRDLSHLSAGERAQHNFDHPEAWEQNRLMSEMKQLVQGQPIERPDYCFETHLRLNRSVRVEPSPYIIAEGLFALCIEPLNAIAQIRIFIHIADDLALQRRLVRDTIERGRSSASIIEQFERTVRPANKKYIQPSAHAAQCHLEGKSSTADQISAIYTQFPQIPRGPSR